MNIQFVTYTPSDIIPPNVICQLQKIHQRDGMMWPCFMLYKDIPQSNMIVSTVVCDGVVRSWSVIFSRYGYNSKGNKVFFPQRYIHAYTQKSFRKKGLGKKCINRGLGINEFLNLGEVYPEGSFEFWKKLGLYESYT